MPLRPGRGLYRLTITATDPDPDERMACIAPARRVVSSVATDWGVTDNAVDDLVAVAGELLANAARHAGPDVVHAQLHLDGAGDRLRFEVEDRSPRLPEVVAALGDDQAVAGRGLLMVSALADQWGSIPTQTGKVVWAELTLPLPIDMAAVASRIHRAAVRADYTTAARMGDEPARIPLGYRHPTNRPRGRTTRP
ncbi:ATP-binding protein [Kitasatospora sp. HPMI-4]|uniref:ATP-binding protein n=1 Tax=Kitasatospora sp. HPMI-4 TaxID=3448443 RepID=UPI003F1AD087